MIHVVLGPPLAGKSSYIDLNSSRGDVVIEWDRLAEALDTHEADFGILRPKTVKSFASKLRVCAIRMAASSLKNETVWITGVRMENGLFEILAQAGADFLMIDPGEDECLKRAEEEGRPQTTLKAIRDWYADPPNIPAAAQVQKGWEEVHKHHAGYLERTTDNMRKKTLNVRIKKYSFDRKNDVELGEGEFTAYASTFDKVPDTYGDIVAPGAFARTLEEWKAKDDPIPLFFGHRLDDPDFNIGEIIVAAEDGQGLYVHGKIDMDSPKGPQVYRLLKSGRLRELSFSYHVRDSEEVRLDDGTKACLLKDVDLLEVSLVQVGANRYTSVLSVKSADEPASTAATQFTPDEADIINEAIEDLKETAARLQSLVVSRLVFDEEKEEEKPVQSATPEDAAAKAATPEESARARIELLMSLINSHCD